MCPDIRLAPLLFDTDLVFIRMMFRKQFTVQAINWYFGLIDQKEYYLEKLYYRIFSSSLKTNW